MNGRPNWKPIKNTNAMTGATISGAALNDIIRDMRSNPRKIGEMGFCPDYVDPNETYTINQN